MDVHEDAGSCGCADRPIDAGGCLHDEPRLRVSSGSAAARALVVLLHVADAAASWSRCSGVILPAPSTDDSPAGFGRARFRTASVWLQMAESQEEVLRILGPAGTGAGDRRRARVFAQCQWDYAFMLCYSANNVALAVLLFSLIKSLKGSVNEADRARASFPFGQRGLKVVLWCIFAAGLSDFFETRQIQLMVSPEAPSEPHLEQVLLISMLAKLKWVSLFCVSFVFAWCYARYMAPFPSSWSRLPLWLGSKFMLLPTLYWAAALTGCLAIAVQQLRPMVEGASLVLGSAWVASWVHALAIVRANFVGHAGARKDDAKERRAARGAGGPASPTKKTR